MLTIITVCIVVVTVIIVGSVIVHDHYDESDHEYHEYMEHVIERLERIEERLEQITTLYICGLLCKIHKIPTQVSQMVIRTKLPDTASVANSQGGGRLFSPSAERNSTPIINLIKRVAPVTGEALELSLIHI